MDQFNAQYHLPGLFEFYALYRLFLPLFFEHRVFKITDGILRSIIVAVEA